MIMIGWLRHPVSAIIRCWLLIQVRVLGHLVLARWSATGRALVRRCLRLIHRADVVSLVLESVVADLLSEQPLFDPV